MTPLVAIGLVATGVLAWLILAPVWRRRRRAVRMAEPLPDDAGDAIDRNVPAAADLPPELRFRLDGLVNAFVAEKEFIGCNGLVVTDEMRATIAALACLLVLGRRGHYDALHSVLIYPTAFWVEDEVEDEAGVVEKRRRVLSGEAWEASRIILSWEDVLEAARFPGEGYNVALHEFAHYLDAEGLGLAGSSRPVSEWADELAEEFESLLDAVDRGADTFLDPYAAEDEAEFFAVASEDFIDRPVELRVAHPRLYTLLVEFYGTDPATWRGRERTMGHDHDHPSKHSHVHEHQHAHEHAHSHEHEHRHGDLVHSHPHEHSHAHAHAHRHDHEHDAAAHEHAGHPHFTPVPGAEHPDHRHDDLGSSEHSKAPHDHDH